jgi:hypothetical protein
VPDVGAPQRNCGGSVGTTLHKKLGGHVRATPLKKFIRIEFLYEGGPTVRPERAAGGLEESDTLCLN